MERRSVLVALGALLTGCSAGAGGPATPQETSTQTSTPTATPASAAADTPTPTPTEAPPPTTTSTATATPEPEPESEMVSGRVGEWVTFEAEGSTVDVMVEAYTTTDGIGSEDLKVPYRDDAPLEPPGDTTWVDATVVLRNHIGAPQTFSHDQWSVRDFKDDEISPNNEAMRKARNTLPEEVELRGGTREEYAVYFAVEYTNQIAFVMEPYEDSDWPTVLIET